MAELQIIVVGAGLSGIATAIACSLAGHSVTVLESTKELGEAGSPIHFQDSVGAGLQLTPNATRLLQTWGLDTLWQTAAEPTYLAVHGYEGKILAMENDFDQKMRSRYGAPFLDIHRVDLQRALYDKALSLGVTFNLGEKVDSINFDIPQVTTVFGSKFRSDLIIAADGLWSRCRDCYLTTQEQPLPTGDLAYRVVLTLDEIQDPELREWVRNPSVHFWIGPGAHAVGYSLRAGEMYNIVLLVPDDLPPDVSRQAGSVEEMKDLFKNWDPILGRFLSVVEKVDKWKLMHRPELESWVNDQSNFVFVGDSCHPMLPYLAQGANSAIEDGAVLGYLLGNMTTKSQLPQALKLYERLRKTRGDAVVKETFKQRESFHMVNGPAQEARDKLFLSQLKTGLTGDAFPSRWTCPQVQPWLYGYDAFKEVQKALENSPFIETETQSENSSQKCLDFEISARRMLGKLWTRIYNLF